MGTGRVPGTIAALFFIPNLTEKLLRSTELNLNHRQLDIVSHALRHPETVYSIKAHQKTNNIAYQTARTDLFGLFRSGLWEKKKRGKEFVFLPATELHAKIRKA
jgi:Fic family protein